MISTSSQLVLVSVLNAFFDAVSMMLRKNVEKRTLLENLDGVLLAMDEIVDGGYVFKPMILLLKMPINDILILF